MYRTILFISLKSLIATGMVFLLAGCERSVDGLQEPSHSSNPEVFINGFSPGLNYAAFQGSVLTAFQVDNEVTYQNSRASMRFEVPDVNDPMGSFAGGVFFTNAPRDLTEYNALTFYARASKPVTIGEVGFGNDLGENTYVAYISELQLNTNWKKVIVPIPEPSKLDAIRGLFFYSAGPQDDRGYTFWFDNVQFEMLGAIAHPQGTILNGQDQLETTFSGISRQIGGLLSTHNMPDGLNQQVHLSPAYFTFSSTKPEVASVDESGRVSVVGGPDTAVITAQLGARKAEGSLTIDSRGAFVHAPVPTRDAADVVSVFSDHYDNIPVSYYNGYWEPWQTTRSDDFEVNGDNILYYTDFNFVGIEFASPLNATDLTHLHMNIYLPNDLPQNARFKIELVNQSTGGTAVFTRTIQPSEAQQWLTLEIPLSSFSGYSGRSNLFQIVFVDDLDNIPGFYADNIYFYKE